MTGTQELLAEYTRNGSDDAFPELVTRYVDLVYSTALRLVEGDTHRAEDVSQLVFAGLAPCSVIQLSGQLKHLAESGTNAAR